MSERCALRAARGAQRGGAVGGWGRWWRDSLSPPIVTGSHMHLIDPCLSGTCVLRVPGRQVER